MNKIHSILSSLALSACLFFSSTASAVLVEYVGANHVTGSDGVERFISVSMTFDDVFNQNSGTPPTVPGSNLGGSFGYFAIDSYSVDVEDMGLFTGSNGRLNIWYERTPSEFSFYTEELEVLEDHSLMSFYDGEGNPWNWPTWLGSSPDYMLAPELVIRRLNITPGYSFDFGNDIHLEPVPIPAAIWLFISGLIGLTGLARHKQA